jgi:hypothetical protein
MRSLGQNPTEQEIQTWVILINSPLFIYTYRLILKLIQINEFGKLF